MNYEVLIDRAIVAIQQSRIDVAEQSLRQAIGLEPSRGIAYSLMSIIERHKDNVSESIQLAQKGVALDPGSSMAHSMLAGAELAAGHTAQAMSSIDQAISFDPGVASYHATRAQICLLDQKWEAALESADKGLSFDPENTDCVNFRAMALTKLRRMGDAGAAVAEALALNPHDSFSHANMGWTQLHAGNHEQAAGHFKESLRLNPNNSWAREGIVEALKARNIVYRLFLKYFLWISSIPERYQLALFIGIIVLLQVMVRLPDGGPLLLIGLLLSLAYMMFVMTVWTASPLFDLLLRMSRFGRMVLTDDQKKDSNWMALGIVLVAILVSQPLMTGFQLLDTIMYMFLMIAVGVTLSVPRTAKRNLAMGITGLLFAMAFVYWFRFYFDSGLPFDIRDEAALANLFKKDASPIELQQQNLLVRFVDQQQNLRQAVSWGTAGMTWFSGMFRK